MGIHPTVLVHCGYHSLTSYKRRDRYFHQERNCLRPGVLVPGNIEHKMGFSPVRVSSGDVSFGASAKVRITRANG